MFCLLIWSVFVSKHFPSRQDNVYKQINCSAVSLFWQIPKFFELCSDNIWGMRKACAECFMAVSCTVSPEVRRTKLSPLFIGLISDPCRWVNRVKLFTLNWSDSIKAVNLCLLKAKKIFWKIPCMIMLWFNSNLVSSFQPLLYL